MKLLWEIVDKLRFYSTLELFRLLPWTWAMQGIKLSATCFYVVCRRKRRQAIDWLQITVTHGTTEQDLTGKARAMFVHASYLRYLSYLLMLHDASEHAAWFEVEGWERVERALAAQKGVVLLSSHVGLHRLERWFLRTKPISVLHLLRIGFAKDSDRSLTARFQRWHQHRYNQDSDNLIGNEESSLQYMKKAYDHLRRNGIVNMAGDGTSGELRYPVIVGGREFLFAGGGVSLGLLSGAPIIPCFTIADSTPRFRIVFEEPLAIPDTANRDEATKALVKEYASRIDAFVRQHPTNVVSPRYSLRIPA